MYQSFMMIGDRLVARYNISKPVGNAAAPGQPAKSSRAPATVRPEPRK